MLNIRWRAIPVLVSCFLVAIGIALGAGPLGGNAEPEKPPAKNAEAPTGAESIRSAEFAEALVAEGAVRLYANGLEGHAVALLAMPGADSETVKELNKQILAAGGATSGSYTADEKLVDPAQRTLIDTLATQLTTQLLGDPRIDPAASTYVRMGQLIALAMATDQPSSVRADPAAVVVRQGLESATVLDSPTDVRNAPLVLVVLPPGPDGADDGISTQAILSGLVNGLASNAAGIVVTGDEDSAVDGELAALRKSELVGPVATVDGVETPLGLTTTVLALESVLTGTGGAYGESGKDGPVPLG